MKNYLISQEIHNKKTLVEAKTKTYFWINAFIREFIATLYIERKSHLKMILIILTFTFILVGFLYIANII